MVISIKSRGRNGIAVDIPRRGNHMPANLKLGPTGAATGIDATARDLTIHLLLATVDLAQIIGHSFLLQPTYPIVTSPSVAMMLPI